MSETAITGACQDVVAGRTWIAAFARLVDDTPESIAIEDERDRRLTRRQLAAHAAATLARLQDLGLAPGDRIGVHLENTLENAALVLALGALGGVCVPVSPKFTAAEIRRQVDSCRPRLFVTDAGGGVVPDDLGVEVVRVDDLVDLRAAEDVQGTAAFLAVARVRTVEEPSTIICTSGSTSAPKPIVLSHGNIMFAVASSQSYYALSPLDSGLTVFPWCHSNGHVNQLLCWLTLGVRVCVADRFTASGFPSQLARFDPTVAPLNSTHVKMVLAKLPADVEKVSSRLRIVPTALEQQADDVRRFTEVFGALLRKVYYQTELVAPVAVADLIPVRTTVNANPVGYVALSHAIRLVDPTGADVPPGRPGEILVRTHVRWGLAVGRMDLETGELIRNDPDAWWHTGDLAVAEPDGFLYYAGRVTEMIKRAGHNVAIPEVLATLVEHPGISDAAVIGVPDPFREEQIIAFVEGNVSEEDVIEFCSARLAEYKVPSRVICLAEIPHTDLGKLDNAALRATWTARARSDR